MPRWPVPGPAPGAIRIRPDQARAASQLDNFSKARLAGQSRPCFLADANRLILPAYGAYTGGLWCDHPDLATLMRPRALAVLTGQAPGTIVVDHGTISAAATRGFAARLTEQGIDVDIGIWRGIQHGCGQERT